MSMPSFPPNGADMTREEALTMILASIAMEELALSHILNAEGEKLQYILGTLPGAKPCAGPQEVLAVNRSVTALVEAVTQNQLLLKNKMERVLEFCPPPCPPEPCPCPCPHPPEPCPCSHPLPCAETPPCEKSALHLTVQREGMLWSSGCRLPWRQQSRLGTDIRWEERSPEHIRFNAQKTYAFRCTLEARALLPLKGTGSLFLRQSPWSAFQDVPPLRFSIEHLTGGVQTIQYDAVLHPRCGCGYEAALSLSLEAESPLCVQRAALELTEL